MSADPATVFALSFCLSAALTPVVRAQAARIGLVVVPSDERWHRRPTPFLGGAAILLGTLVPALALLGAPRSAPWIASGAGALAAAALGFADDVHRLGPAAKLSAQVAAAALPVAFGLGIPQLPPLLSVPIAVVWIVAITNAMNFLDNMDGLSAGVAAVAASILAIDAARRGDFVLAGWAGALAGACVGFLPCNFNPASIFMGDGGSLFLGYSLGVLSLLGLRSREPSSLASLAIPLLVLLVPLLDTCLVTIARLSAGRSPAQGGRDHASHRLVARGLTERQAVLLLWWVAAVGGAASLAF